MIGNSLVSIIMPAYNAAGYIQMAIQSVFNQSYIHWELLIIDDGSTDETESIVKNFNDKRIRYFKQVNQGVSAARNVGLMHMKGDYFSFLDADDIYPSNSLESRLVLMESASQASFVDGQVIIKDSSLTKTINTKKHTFRGNPFNALLKLDECCFFGPSWMIRRDKNKIYQFREGLTHGEDLLFYLNLSRDGGEYLATDSPVLIYRSGNASAMRNIKGLEKGYLQIYHILGAEFKISEAELAYYKKKVRSIIFKSYLGHLQPLMAISSFLRFSSL